MKNTLLAVFFTAAVAAQMVLGQDDVVAFDKYVEAARVQWNVPGMSVVVVKDGKVLLSKGYGVRELGKDDKVGTKTLFGCMSTTKAMTAVAMGMLVDEGKLNWNDKVTKYLPYFRVDDRYVTGDIRVRDLLTHNTGVATADFLWDWTPELSSDEIVRRMQYAKQDYPLRGGFSYHNIMYLVAGQVIEKASGMSWENFVTQRIFKPLGMNNTFANYSMSQIYTDRATSHFEIKGKIQTIPDDESDNVGPAGSVWSTADDIGKWVNFMLGNTTVGGKELLKPSTYNEMIKPQVIVPPGEFYPTEALTKPHWTTYGLGWFQHDYRGEKVDFHTGSLPGRVAIIGLIPEKKIGIYIFANLEHTEVRHALMYKAFDVFGFGDNSRDWSTEAKALYDGLTLAAKKQTEELKAKCVLNTKPSLEPSGYAGKYSDPFYGSLEIAFADGKLRLIVNKNVAADLDHWHFDTFQATWNKPWWGESLVTFKLDPITGKAISINVDGAELRKVP